GVRVALEEGPALTLRHATPDAPLDLVLERLGEALGLHRAPGAHLLGLVLLRATYEKLVGLAHTASCLACPVFIPHDCRPHIRLARPPHDAAGFPQKQT